MSVRLEHLTFLGLPILQLRRLEKDDSGRSKKVKRSDWVGTKEKDKAEGGRMQREFTRKGQEE
jgi:hypothetical protein